MLDQLVKMLVKVNLQPGEEVNLLGEFFKIHFTENKGAAFGLTFTNLIPGLPDATAKVILSLFSFFALFLIIYFLWRAAKFRSPLPWFVALILGGAAGNIMDRMFYGIFYSSINDYEGGFMFGRVVDMFYFDLGFHYIPNWVPIFGGKGYQLWPIFNIADMAISIGIITILVFQSRFHKTHLTNSAMASESKKAEPAEEPASPATEATEVAS